MTAARTIQHPARIAGILLVCSLLILILALIILITGGALPAFSAGLQGSMAEKAPYVSTFRLAYVTHLVATAVFGWAILRSTLLSSWVGRFVVAWSLSWLLGYFIGAGAPGILFIMPGVIGIELLRRG